MKYNNQFPALIAYLFSVLALIVYLYGFFPIDYSTTTNAHNRYAEEKIIYRKRQVHKLVFIVIDALRYDFVMPNDDQIYMNFTTNSILRNQSCLIKTKAQSPTVTMPRIKAITSGTLSNYIDVVLNFMNYEFSEDNFINKATLDGLKIVFYGDETWLKLFPKTFFRSEGTNSFFTTDYTEVDNNVTRHLDEEFGKADWDILILHYLGLDHIGHTEGPESYLIKEKLNEMDGIVKNISTLLKKMEREESMKTMLLVTSDHGMKDSGGHGGVTYSEVIVPLVSVGNPCLVFPGWPENYTSYQIDIAPTLSAIFGLSLPVNNMGKLIPSLLHNMQPEDLFKYLDINKLALEKLTDDNQNGGDSYSLSTRLNSWLLSEEKDQKVGQILAKLYFQCLNQLSQDLTNSVSNFKHIYLVLGTIFLWITLFYLLRLIKNQFPKPKDRLHWFLIFGTAFHAVSVISTSYIEEEHQIWYFLWTTFCVLSLLKFSSCKMLSKVEVCVTWVGLLCIHRILRKLNQTGDKWASLPDLKHYFSLPEGQALLLIVFLLGISLLFWCAWAEKCSYSQLVIYGICLLSVICYRISTGSFNISFLSFYPSSGTAETFMFWIFMVTFCIQTIYHKIPIHLPWLLLVSLLMRPHNVILLPIQVITSQQINKMFYKKEEFVWNNISHIWLGNLFFFYQGNGNSLSNVDVASGFVGLQKYNSVYAGIMIAVHTFNSHILSFILSPKSVFIYGIARIIPLTVYCTFLIFQLEHLFIWSVFSPKLLYETSKTIGLLITMLISSFCT